MLAGASGAQDYSAWAHHKDIYFDTSPSGAGVSDNVTGFPVLVRLRSADFPFAEARGDGRDLRFSKPDGSTPMPFEIDRYDSAAGEADIWVLADTVKGNTKGALTRLHWGNPSAAASGDSAKVFTASNGFVAVWHLRGQYQSGRPNSVAAGKEAVPGNYDADEQTRGIIAFADSMDGGSPGDHLQTWQPFDTLSKAFTFSIWAYPTAVAAWGRFLDFGNGANSDNLVLGRSGTSDSLRFDNFRGSQYTSIAAPDAIVLNQWQLFAVTVSGKTARLYRNGVEVASGELGDTITAIARNSQYIGRGNWSNVAYYRGKVDEPEISAAARGPGWLKLAYANQRADQRLLSFTPLVVCETRFAVPGDTSLPEGATISLAAKADCTDQYFWSQESGPALRILNPENTELDLVMPRVPADTAVILRFTAQYGDSIAEKEVRISILNAVPEPKLSLPAKLSWSGRDSLLIKPTIANRAAIDSSAYPDLRANWSLEGIPVDTLLRAEDLVLLPTPGMGELIVSLCLDNGGPPACASVTVTVGGGTVGVESALRGRPAAGSRSPGYGADGRLRPGSAGAMPRFLKPRDTAFPSR